MGNIFQTKEQKSLRDMAEEILKENEFTIRDYFNSFEVEKIEKTKPNNIQDLNVDRPIIKNISPKENRYQLNIDIYNFPALFRVDNGLFSIVNQISIYFDIFRAKYSHMNENELIQKFILFFKSLLELDSTKINELLELNITKNDLIGIKHGMEKIIDYFGIENINYFLKKLICIGGGAMLFGAILGLASVIAKTTVLCTSVFSGVGIGIAIGFLGYFIWTYFSKESQKEELELSQKNIQIFFEEIEAISNTNIEYLFDNKNLFVIAIKKNKQNINDVCLFLHNIDNLNSQNCPSIGAHATADSNSDYYICLIDGIKAYHKKYALKIHNHVNNIEQKPNLINELEKDILFLKTQNKAKIKEEIKKINKSTESSVSSVSNNASQNTDFGLPGIPREYETKEEMPFEEESNNNQNIKTINIKQQYYCH